MVTKQQSSQSYDVIDTVEVTLPLQAVEQLSPQFGAQNGSATNTPEGIEALCGAAAGKSESFPCSKKALWHDHVVIQIIPGQPTAA